MLVATQQNSPTYRGVELLLMSKVQCMLCFEIFTIVGRGGEKGGGSANFKTNHPEHLTSEIFPALCTSFIKLLYILRQQIMWSCNANSLIVERLDFELQCVNTQGALSNDRNWIYYWDLEFLVKLAPIIIEIYPELSFNRQNFRLRFMVKLRRRPRLKRFTLDLHIFYKEFLRLVRSYFFQTLQCMVFLPQILILHPGKEMCPKFWLKTQVCPSFFSRKSTSLIKFLL